MDSAEMRFAVAATATLLICFIVRWFRTLKRVPATPDPWGPEVTAALELPDAKPVCLHCQCPYESTQWFCRECGRSVGDYNNVNPYLYLFSVGEMFREGASGPVQKNWLTIAGFILLSLAEYAVFAPVYWYYLFRNLTRQDNHPQSGSSSTSCASENLG